MTPREQLTILSGLALNGLIASGNSSSPEPGSAATTAIDLALALQSRLYGGLVPDEATQATIAASDLLEMLERWASLSERKQEEAKLIASNDEISSAARIAMVKAILLEPQY